MDLSTLGLAILVGYLWWRCLSMLSVAFMAWCMGMRCLLILGAAMIAWCVASYLAGSGHRVGLVPLAFVVPLLLLMLG